jgi:2-polyprenyl-3-methyl-5-hydroxy-6-metoxy-1,4-benzoquinol methylase
MEKTLTIQDPTERFAFGKNWSNFLKTLDESRIEEAIKILQEKLGLVSLEGKTFLDIGSGSGLFSLAAYRLGATVYSFDYDQDSVACTRYLRKTYSQDESKWSVEQGSVLDQDFLKKFEKVDILYSWGVLHRTGHMYQAFENVCPLVKEEGVIFVAIYNDQGGTSVLWKKIKSSYVKSGAFGKKFIEILCTVRLWGPTCVKDFIKSGNPFKTWSSYKDNNRGMSAWYDVEDCVGVYPFEVAKPEEVFNFFKDEEYFLERLKTCAGELGCNEFVFKTGK